MEEQEEEEDTPDRRRKPSLREVSLREEAACSVHLYPPLNGPLTVGVLESTRRSRVCEKEDESARKSWFEFDGSTV